MLDYIKRWDGRSPSLYLTAPAARFGWNLLAIGQPPDSSVGVVPGLPEC